MADLFTFEWPVDQAGYEIVHIPARNSGALLGNWDAYDAIQPRRGSPRYYRPLDDPSLWRRFTDVRDAKDALAFVSQFGMLDDFSEQRVEDVRRWAYFVFLIADRIDADDRGTAAEIFTEHARPSLTAGIVQAPKGRLEIRLAPCSLLAAMLVQAAEAITGNRRFRRCRNCAVWFLLGAGGHSTRREFCSDRCRVAWARHSKREASHA